MGTRENEQDRTDWFVPKGEELTEKQFEDMRIIRGNCINFYRSLQAILGEGRRASLVYTKLEELSHMAIKAVTHG